MAEALDRLKPDIMVILGDRFEIFSAATAAMLLQIPIAHIHGGEATEGLIDEPIRHSISKMSHLHFTAAEAYRNRVIQLGENPERVFVVGALCLDTFDVDSLIDRPTLIQELGFDLGKKFFLVTYHPVTLRDDNPKKSVQELLRTFDAFPKYKVLITGVNADPGNNQVSKAFADYANKASNRVKLVSSLGQAHYLSAMKHAAAVVGNSSSGIIEAPAMDTPTINIGPRQRGRERADSVIDCDERKLDIVAAINTAVDPKFRSRTANAPYPFGTPGAAKRIKDVLATCCLDNILMKRFHDIGLAL